MASCTAHSQECCIYCAELPVICHRYDEARKLLREYAEVDTSDAEGNTPLMLASKAGHGRLVKLLVRKGATLDALNAEGSTAEQLAMRCEHNGIASFLQGACKGSLLQSKRS